MCAKGKSGRGSVMHRAILGTLIVATLTGCASRKSSLLLERHARGPLSESEAIAQPIGWQLQPNTQVQDQSGVEVSVTAASMEFLDTFFGDRTMFKDFAGKNPYFQENLVFYIKVTNRGTTRIRFDPTRFMLIDDRGNQYSPINEDYVNALAEAREPVATTTRGLLEDARPGYFGLSLPVGKIVAAKPQGRYALIKQSSLQAGDLYPAVLHDGLVAFWSPSKEAKTLRFLVTNVKTNFDANDFPKTSLDFSFSFNATQEPVEPPANRRHRKKNK